MLCERCEKRQATVRVERVVNNEKTVHHLCEQCASEQGELGVFLNPMFSLNQLLSALLNDESAPSRVIPAGTTARCPTCGLTYSDFARQGRLGCSDCYQAFEERLDSVLRRIHGSGEHVGKVPKRAGAGLETKRELERLRAELADAVRHEAYERAADLRDRIRALERKQS
jgi:protein arginine kinase activator